MLDYDLLSSYNNKIIISNQECAALSIFSELEFILFELYKLKGEVNAIYFLTQLGYTQSEIQELVKDFKEKLRLDGWQREKVPKNCGQKLQSVYLDITNKCNFNCNYCYFFNTQERIKSGFIQIKHVKLIIEKIASLNPNCRIIVSGGEPFLHKDILKILQIIEDSGLNFSILTNGSLINNENAHMLSTFQNLKNIQISLDGITESTHRITRGETFNQVMEGIKSIVKFKVPFSIAPTLHDGNLNEIYDIARFAYLHDGGFTPNNLRILSNSQLNNIHLKEENFLKILIEIEKSAAEEFGEKYIMQKKMDSYMNVKCNRNHFICGVGYSLLDINWNGDVYPCHLLRHESLKLGNIFTNNFEEIFNEADIKNIRIYSYQIDKCKKCHFMSDCGGGCKASSFYIFGNFSHEDELCNMLYQHKLKVLTEEIKGVI